MSAEHDQTLSEDSTEPMQDPASQSGRFAIVSHSVFKPAMMGWAGAILAAIVLILPAASIARLTALTGLGMLGDFSRVLFAVIGAVVGAGLGYALAAALQNKGERAEDNDDWDHAELEEDTSDESVQPIDPAAELGTESLDAPIEFADYEELEEAEIEPATVAEPQESEGGSKQPVSLPDAMGVQTALDALIASTSGAPNEPLTNDPENPEALETKAIHEGATLPDAPLAMGLDEFAAMPGRDGVWVDGIGEGNPSESAASETDLPSENAPGALPPESGTPARTQPVPTALAKLRATPLEELSMVQMIERFAAALEDRKAAYAAGADDLQPSLRNAPRDKILMEALKELASPLDQGSGDPSGLDGSEDAAQQQLSREKAKLRDALDKLGDLRGAAAA